MVEHLDGSSGMIVRRGSNYVSYETEDGLIKKAWLYDLQEEFRIPRKKRSTQKLQINIVIYIQMKIQKAQSKV